MLRLLAGLCAASFPYRRRTAQQTAPTRSPSFPGIPSVHVPCSLTSVRASLWSGVAFHLPDGVGLERFLYAAQSHGPRTRCLRFAFGSPLQRKTRFRMYLARTLGLGRTGFPPAGFHSKVSTHGILLGWTWAGAPGRSEGRKELFTDHGTAFSFGSRGGASRAARPESWRRRTGRPRVEGAGPWIGSVRRTSPRPQKPSDLPIFL